MSSEQARRTRALLACAVAGAIGCLLCARGQLLRTLSAYLFAWLYFLGLSLGSLGALMMHHLTGGRWSVHVHRYFLAALAPLPLLAVLFAPVILGMAHLYPWVHDSERGGGPLQFKSTYLTSSAFIARTITALVVWIVLARLLRAHDAARGRAVALSAAGLIVYAVSMTWAAVDWIGSLAPSWSSSALGLIALTGQGLAAFALATRCALRTNRPPEAAECVDLGNLLLTFVMTWMYLAFVQFLIIWAEDLPRETSWFFARVEGRWQALSLVVVVGQFGVPFSLLLFRQLKRDAVSLGRIALVVLLSNWLYAAWLIVPSTQPAGPLWAWPDLAATAAIGGAWCLAFLRALERHRGDALSLDTGGSGSGAELTHGS